MASMTSVLLLLFGGLLFCGRLRCTSSQALPSSRSEDDWKLRSFSERRPFISATSDLAERRRAERMPQMKRLMGLLRCSGWGPGCSRIDDGGTPTFRSRSYNNAVHDDVGGGGGGKAASAAEHSTSARHRRPTIKFQPFFTLTSGSNCCLHKHVRHCCF